MEASLNKTLLHITALMFLTVSASVLASGWSEYEARYSLYRNGKLAGKVEMTMTREGDEWTISTQGNGTHGIARLLRAKDKERVVGTFKDGKFFPSQFEHRISVAGIGSEWSAQYDWANDTVMVDYDKKTFPLPLEGAALDGLSLKMEIQRRLREGDDNMQYLLLDEDEIKQQNFRVLPTETLETSLGCLETIPVEPHDLPMDLVITL